MIKAVLFDFDGVFVDSDPANSEAISRILRSYGKEPRILPNGLVQPTGMRAEDVWPILMQKYGFVEDLDILVNKVRAERVKMGDYRELLPGAKEAVHMAKKHRFKIALVTGSNNFAVRALDNFGIKKYFNTLVLGTDITKGKPDPQGYLLAMKRLDVEPSESIVIEDSVPGVLSGKNAGAEVIAIPNKYSTDGDFSKADMILNSLEELTWEKINEL